MALVVPKPIKAYNQQLSIFPALSYREPVEGKMIVPLEFDWDGAGTTLEVNVAGRTGQPFSQIVTMDVDNSQSGADVTFIFPDTQDTLAVPAYSAGTFPVFTAARTFYAAAPSAIAGDITRVRVLNFRHEPVANPSPQFHQAASLGTVAIANGPNAIIAPAITGTLVGYTVFGGFIAGAATVNFTASLKDHAGGTVFDQASVTVPANGAMNAPLMNVMGVAFRFTGGLDLVIANEAGAIAGGFLSVAARYRSP